MFKCRGEPCKPGFGNFPYVETSMKPIPETISKSNFCMSRLEGEGNLLYFIKVRRACTT